MLRRNGQSLVTLEQVCRCSALLFEHYNQTHFTFTTRFHPVAFHDHIRRPNIWFGGSGGGGEYWGALVL